MSKALKKKKYRNKIEEVITLLTNGHDLEYVKSELSIDDDELETLYSEALKDLSEKLKNKPNEIIYAEYFIDVMKVNKSIDEHITNLQGSKNTKEIAQILKVKLELAKEVHIHARERLGLIRKPDEIKNIGSVNLNFFNNLSNVEKRQEMLRFSKDYLKLAKKIESTPTSMLELDAGEIHYGDSINELSNDEKEIIDEDEE